MTLTIPMTPMTVTYCHGNKQEQLRINHDLPSCFPGGPPRCAQEDAAWSDDQLRSPVGTADGYLVPSPDDRHGAYVWIHDLTTEND